jgi:hypothetical protein
LRDLGSALAFRVAASMQRRKWLVDVVVVPDR